MTFSEKLKEARKNAGLTQEQVSEKLCVSRQAVTKWESGKGMPDIENIKAISKLLNISIDYLLSDDSLELNEIKEKINPSDYKAECILKVWSDSCVKAKYPYADRIVTLTRLKKLSKKEWLADFIIGAGSLQIADQLANLEEHFYLVYQGEKQYFVCIDNDFITSAVLSKPYVDKKFQRGEYIYKFGYELIKNNM